MDGNTDDGNKPRAWGKSLDVVKSISLDRVASDVNRHRLKRLRKKIAGPLSEKERTKMRRVIAMEAEGRLEELPSDLRANAHRMKRILLLIFLKVGPRPKWSFKVDELAEEFGETPETVRRGILDLEEASLVEVTRKQHHWKGGWWRSEYRLVWPNLRELAEGRDVQRSLFDGGEGADPVRAEGFPSVEPVGQGPGDGSMQTSHSGPITRCEKSTSHREDSISHGGYSTSHCEKSISHSDRASTHSERSLNAQAHARANSFSSSSFKSNSSPSLSLIRTEKKKDFENGRQAGRQAFEPCDRPEWESARSRLQPLISAWAKAINNAAAKGWSPMQVAELLDQFEKHSLGDIRAWKVGSLYWQLVNGIPGSLIDMPMSDAYVRALRDQKQAAERKAHEARMAAKARSQDLEVGKAEELESRFGPQLDALDEDGLRNLIDRADLSRQERADILQGAALKVRISPLSRFGQRVRPKLLRRLAEESECHTTKSDG